MEAPISAGLLPLLLLLLGLEEEDAEECGEEGSAEPEQWTAEGAEAGTALDKGEQPLTCFLKY